MEHLLLFYRIILYTIGFAVLVLAFQRYITVRSNIIRAFLLFWSSMTFTAAAYVIDFYIIKNTGIGWFSYSYIALQMGALFTSVSLPYFIHKLFLIKKMFPVLIFAAVCTPLLILVSIPLSSEWTERIVDFVMITIVAANIYSFAVSVVCIIRLKNNKDRFTGIFFLVSFIILFSLLVMIDIYPGDQKNDFLIFPLFYTWTGLFFTVLGFKKLKSPEGIIKSIPDEFISKFKLTKREAEIILLLIDGVKYKTIADKLFISLNTANTHIRHIYEKTKTGNKVQLRKLISTFI